MIVKVSIQKDDRVIWERATRDAENRFKDVTGGTHVLADVSGPRISVGLCQPKSAMEINKVYVCYHRCICGGATRSLSCRDEIRL